MLERLLRQLHENNVTEARILISEDQSHHLSFRREFSSRYVMHLTYIPTRETITQYLSKAKISSDVLLLNAHVLHDLRIIKKLVDSTNSLIIVDENHSGPCAAKFIHDISIVYDNSGQDIELRKTLLILAQQKSIEVLRVSEMQSYVRFLRRHATPLFQSITPSTDMNALEHIMYEDTFKGGMEWIAVYGYKIPVRELTKWCARTSWITPNVITALATIGKLVAIPFFFIGWIGWALLSFWIFTIGDSLDGKLARMTVRFSKTADRVDHLTSAPARMLWHFGLTWYMCGGNLTSPIGMAGIGFSLLPQIDKFGLMYFNWKFGRSPIDFTSFDARVHLYTARRNDMVLLTIGYLAGFLLPAFYGMMAWMYLTWLWHVVRISWFSFINPVTRGSVFKKHTTHL
ncbi:MAG TPA: CDP-alcohol phosphatidyltransferase family protein [bacterium]|nr:CDP-alcohol phosphatidyltransferase family protein [bacterium]HMW35091.1 CDP-alcohol phosphatidyltransferase family protein [bacterium]HMY35122.1 CDP-alcohol phosphatidyltransferase family protein [bacterium]HMZ04356.1 CDP-alcohol phosphatidyltransferase family protein [bacterium]HNB09140.1 CDP-alcohol phosphatidyltransferase family protein [bacterium]